ncbi:helix-turn-helix domain-containing protein [Weissella cibaria]
MLLREKINEIRQAKRVSIDRITKTGISKNKYYRFVSGEGSLSIGDLQKLIELLTVSLSEVVADSSERDQLIFNEFGDYFTLDVAEYEQRAKNAARRYMATKLTAYYTISTVYELGARIKKLNPPQIMSMICTMA